MSYYKHILYNVIITQNVYIATATDAEIDKPDPFADIDENKLEENEVVLEDC